MIPVVLGGFLGLYFFLRGCVLLVFKPGVAAVSSETPTPTTAVTTRTSFAIQGNDPLTSESRDIIRLSPASELTDATSMTQQGKIAAALTKAGISNPSSWKAARDHSSMVDIAEEQSVRETTSGKAVHSLDLTASKIVRKSASPAVSHTPTSSHGARVQGFHWKPALMVWGGTILTMVCMYILVVHFGWL